ncbi:pyruvate oxidase [Halalkalibacillus halophilus]|uniref:pyruvate oxidase n=1 Tax=Halalkalibacillus halophilus TaxID=392827 RepID=UPI0004017457|nr:pyruvate oxidase [Halalkalibacillus halophilus]
MFEKRTGEIIVDQLLEWGVDHMYGMPGDSINNLIEDLRKKQDKIAFYHVRHEEVGALAAASYAKLTGKLGVCLSIAGPGAAHLMNGLYDAKLDRAPVLALVGQVESSKVGTHVHQEIDLEQLFSGVAVYSKRVTSAEQMPDMLNMAIRQAYNHQGVSVLIVPDDLFTVKQSEGGRKTGAIKPNVRMEPAQEVVSNSVKLLNKAKKPVILAGKGARNSREELLEFAHKMNAPIILSLLGKGVIPDFHELNLGQHGGIGTKPAYQAMKETDLLILIGTNFPYREFLPDDVNAIQIDIEMDQIGQIYPVTEGLCGDAKLILPKLISSITPSNDDKFLKKYQDKIKKWHEQIVTEKRKVKDPLQGPQVMNALEKYVDEDANISCDVGNVTVWVTRYFPFKYQKFILSGDLASMGSGLPGAIASHVAYPDKQAVAICGDGGFSMVMHDFITAVQYDMPVKIIVLNNSKIGMIKYEQQQKGNQNYKTDIADVNYADFAKACGGDGFRINSYDELDTKMQQAFLSDRPTVIDVAIEDIPPLPGQISYEQAANYSKYLIKEFFESGKIDFPDLKPTIQRVRR